MGDEMPEERESVRTTIVGGRPPGSGKDLGDVPRGVEVLIKRAAVDKDFRVQLLQQRSGAAETIGLDLQPAEEMMLDAAPKDQLEGIIDRTHVGPSLKKILMTGAAAAMLAAVSAGVIGCDPGTKGIRPDSPKPAEQKVEEDTDGAAGGDGDGQASTSSENETEDRPSQSATKGIRPDSPTRGIRPDYPEPDEEE